MEGTVDCDWDWDSFEVRAAGVEAARLVVSPSWSTEMFDPGLSLGMRAEISELHCVWLLFSFHIVLWFSMQAGGALQAYHSLFVLGSPNVAFDRTSLVMASVHTWMSSVRTWDVAFHHQNSSFIPRSWALLQWIERRLCVQHTLLLWGWGLFPDRSEPRALQLLDLADWGTFQVP